MESKNRKSELVMDLSKSGLSMLFRPYQRYLLEHIWKNVDKENPIGSGKAHEFIQTTDDKKSRASVIFFLDDMDEEGVLGWHNRTGKGGHHKKYYPLMNRSQFWSHVTEIATEKLIEASNA